MSAKNCVERKRASGRRRESRLAPTNGSARPSVRPLDPPSTEVELNRASAIWTEAQDIMVKRGFGRELWGNQRQCCHEFVVLMLRSALNGKMTGAGGNTTGASQ